MGEGANYANAGNVVRISKPHSELDQRSLYRTAILTEALKKTIKTYGNFRIEKKFQAPSRNRALIELVRGERINVHMVPTKIEWEDKTIPIRIPLTKGLLGYRIFLINKENLNVFSALKSLSDLKALSAGLREQWSITDAMRKLGFSVVTATNYEGLFGLLMRNRFDYFPRGINEIYSEFADRSDKYPDMIIEPTISLYLPLPVYVFVSPTDPDLAERIEVGLQKMILDGSFDRIFFKYFGSVIKQSNLKQRKVFYVENPILSPETPLNQPDYWFTP